MSRRLWRGTLRASAVDRIRLPCGCASLCRSARHALSISPAYLWRNLTSLSSAPRCPHAGPTVSFSTSTTTAPPSKFDRNARPLGRSPRGPPVPHARVKYLRYLSNETDTQRVLKWVDFYRRAIAALPTHDALIDTHAQYDADALEQLAYSERVTPLDYCVLIFHLLRVDAKELAASLINEMTARGLSIRAAIRALFAHHLIVSGRPHKAKEMLAPNIGSPTNHFTLTSTTLDTEQRRERVTEHLPPTQLPADVAALLMAPDDAPFFRSRLFQQLTFKQRAEAWGRGAVVPLDSVVLCFDFLRQGGYLLREVAGYHYVMQRLAEVGQTAECRRVFRDMKVDGVTPTGESYLLLMQSLSVEQYGTSRLNDLLRHKVESAPDADDAAAVSSESRRRQVAKLQLLILHSELLQRRIAVPSHLYSLLIQACCLADDSRRAFQLVAEMRAHGHSVPLHVIHALLALLSLNVLAIRSIVKLAEQAGAGMSTLRWFTESALRPGRAVGEVVSFLAELRAGKWTWPTEVAGG